MIDESFIPKNVQIVTGTCQSSQVKNIISTLCFKDKNITCYHNAICSFERTTRDDSACSNLSLTCNIRSVSFNSMEALCRYKTKNAIYSCKGDFDHWYFYPSTADFSSYKSLMLFTTLLCLVALLSVAFNGTILVVFLRSKLLRNTNGIICAIHMIVADFLIGFVSIPLYLLVTFCNHHYLFRGELFISQEMLVELQRISKDINTVFFTISILNITLISLERLVSVHRPFWYVRSSSIKRALLTIPPVWIYCGVLVVIRKNVSNSIWVVFAMIIAVPIFIMTITYTVLFISVKKKKVQQTVCIKGQMKSFHTNIESKIMTRLLILIIVFIICWMPYFTMHILSETNPRSFLRNVTKREIFRYFAVLAQLHTVFDALLYSVAKSEFRKEIKRMWHDRSESRKTDSIVIGSAIVPNAFPNGTYLKKQKT